MVLGTEDEAVVHRPSLTLVGFRSWSMKPGQGWGPILIGWRLCGEVIFAVSWMKARSRSWEDWGRSAGRGDGQCEGPELRVCLVCLRKGEE